jgi:hypothetical protein
VHVDERMSQQNFLGLGSAEAHPFDKRHPIQVDLRSML